MPRRPRPGHRARPRSKGTLPHRNHVKPPTKSQQHVIRPLIANAHEGNSSEDDENYPNEGDGYFDDRSDDSDNEDKDLDGDEEADTPRVAQWMDEDELEEQDDGSSGEEGEEAGSPQLRKLQNEFSSLPFGALRKAQFVLNHAEAVTDSEGSDEGDGSAGDELPVIRPVKGEAEVKWSTKSRKDVPKRSNKHAPVEVTSKKPVTRLRPIVEVKKSEPRDPRFLSVAGEFKAEKFHKNYSFLADVHHSELGTLRDNLKRARKLLGNAPRHLRDDYEAEVQRLELAVKRAESVVNRERMEGIQREALQKAEKDEKERRRQGKGNWYLKNAEKRELMTRARYEALAADGGKRAVKKAIEKRQKKISQKEKKSRPFFKSATVDGDTRKWGAAGGDNGARKRRKVG